MILKFSGKITLWDKNFDLFGREPYMMVSVGGDTLYHEIMKTEIDGHVFMDVNGERIEGEIYYDQDSESPSLRIGERDILGFLSSLAEQEAQVWLSDKPFSASQVSKMANFYANRDEWDKAMRYFAEAMSLDTQNPEHIFRYIQCVTGADKIAEVGGDAVLDLTSQAINLKPVRETLFILLNMRAAIYDVLGKTEEADRERVWIEKICSSAPGNLRDRILEGEEIKARPRSDDRPAGEDSTNLDARL